MLKILLILWLIVKNVKNVFVLTVCRKITRKNVVVS